MVLTLADTTTACKYPNSLQSNIRLTSIFRLGLGLTGFLVQVLDILLLYGRHKATFEVRK